MSSSNLLHMLQGNARLRGEAQLPLLKRRLIVQEAQEPKRAEIVDAAQGAPKDPVERLDAGGSRLGALSAFGRISALSSEKSSHGAL